ncbi:MAG: hypothetical protein GIW99_06790 [Candidatus Eremiobacteraeota bacterium]|nr:hypothetical protein [Candidatus Eremiobacteraeota bacterium]MBC5827373.1 hypothetical protein [Candidatus Eremiobacteraeota bacterium]
MRRRLTCAALIAVATAIGPRPAAAHPLGNFTINHLVKARIAGDRLSFRYVLDIAEIPTFQIMRSRSSSGMMTSAQMREWAQETIGQIESDIAITLDGRQLRLKAAAAPRVSTRPGAGGLPTLYWSEDFYATRAGAPKDAHRLTIVDRTFPGRIGWKDIAVAPEREPTDELRHYPSAMLSSPRDINSVEIVFHGGSASITRSSQSVSETAGPPASQVRTNTLSDMLSRGTANPLFIALTLLIALGLGALHALEPGHGKTLLAVSLVGARATARQAMILASALTLAHTAGVIVLGIVLLFAAQWMVPEAVYPWITVFSGALVVLLGANALARYVQRQRESAGPRAAADSHAHRHHEHAHPHVAAGHHDHSHAHDLAHRRGDGHDHTRGHGHSHGHDHAIPGAEPLSFRSVVLIAMSGNIAPCPAALVVLLTALSLHRVGYGLLVVIAFSIGLAAVLTGLGIAFVRGAKWLSGRPAFDRAVTYGPLVSACVIACIGAAMVGQGLRGTLHLQTLMIVAATLLAVAVYALRPTRSRVRAHAVH